MINLFKIMLALQMLSMREKFRIKRKKYCIKVNLFPKKNKNNGVSILAKVNTLWI